MLKKQFEGHLLVSKYLFQKRYHASYLLVYLLIRISSSVGELWLMKCANMLSFTNIKCVKTKASAHSYFMLDYQKLSTNKQALAYSANQQMHKE